jgi:hypothetical protein
LTWNYHVVIKDGQYAIYEIYYDDEGNIALFTEDPVYPMGESLDELRGDLEYLRHALTQPVLKYEEITEQARGFQINDEDTVDFDSLDL